MQKQVRRLLRRCLEKEPNKRLRDVGDAWEPKQANGAGDALATGFDSTTLNHVSILVSDVPRSAAFYQRVFNLSVLDEDKKAPRIRLRLGKDSHLTIRRRNPAGTVDHFAIGVSLFNKEWVIQDLKQRGATPQEGGDAGLHVKDPDGYTVQVVASESA